MLERLTHRQIDVAIADRAAPALDLKWHFRAFHFLPILPIAVGLQFLLVFLRYSCVLIILENHRVGRRYRGQLRRQQGYPEALG